MNELTLLRKWYVVPDDLVGGWAIALRDAPVSEIEVTDEILLETNSREVANYVTAMHNYRIVGNKV